MKSKVLFILHWPPPVHGSSVVGSQIKESKIINEMFDCTYINLGTSKTVDEIGKNSIAKLLRYIYILWEVMVNLMLNRPALCYFAITAKGMAFYKDAFVVSFIKLFRVKIVYHFHNKGVSTRRRSFINNMLYRFVFKNTDAILLSQYLYLDIQEFFAESKVHICPNGIPEISSMGTKQKIQNKVVKILFLSNLIESKGVFVLLQSCSVLKQKGIPFECDFIGGEGDINANRFIEKVKLLRLTNHVKYLGKMYGEEKDRAFINADIFAFPTYYTNECFPLVLLEAMKYGLPVVTTYEGGIPDIVDDVETGFLVHQKDSDTFAEKLEVLIRNPELCESMGKAGINKYNQKFTLIKFELRLKEIIAQLTN